MKKIVNVVIKNGKAFCSLAGGGLLVMSQQAYAALPAEATAAFTAIGTAITDIVAAVWVPIGLVVAAFVTIKLFKRGTSKV